MKNKKILAFTLFLSSVLLNACSRANDTPSGVSDIIGAKVVKKLLQNIPLSKEFELTLVGFGYKQGSNCFQQIEETSPNGEKKTVVRFFRTSCPNFPVETAPLGEIRILKLPLNNKQIIYFGAIPVGELDDRGAINNLCFGAYAKRCDVILGDDGSISTFEAKNVSDTWPVIAPNSPSEKSLLWIVNHFGREELLTTGLTEDEATTVFTYRSTNNKFNSIKDISEFGKVSAASGFLLLDYAQFSGLDKVSGDLQSSSRVLLIRNECGHPVRIAIMALAQNPIPWQPIAWYNIGVGDDNRVADLNLEGKRHVIRPMSESLLIYAETTNGPFKKWQGDLNVAVDGKSYPFMPWKAYRSFGGDLFIKLTCS